MDQLRALPMFVLSLIVLLAVAGGDFNDVNHFGFFRSEVTKDTFQEGMKTDPEKGNVSSRIQSKNEADFYNGCEGGAFCDALKSKTCKFGDKQNEMWQHPGKMKESVKELDYVCEVDDEQHAFIYQLNTVEVFKFGCGTPCMATGLDSTRTFIKNTCTKGDRPKKSGSDPTYHGNFAEKVPKPNLNVTFEEICVHEVAFFFRYMKENCVDDAELGLNPNRSWCQAQFDTVTNTNNQYFTHKWDQGISFRCLLHAYEVLKKCCPKNGKKEAGSRKINPNSTENGSFSCSDQEYQRQTKGGGEEETRKIVKVAVE